MSIRSRSISFSDCVYNKKVERFAFGCQRVDFVQAQFFIWIPVAEKFRLNHTGRKQRETICQTRQKKNTRSPVNVIILMQCKMMPRKKRNEQKTKKKKRSYMCVFPIWRIDCALYVPIIAPGNSHEIQTRTTLYMSFPSRENKYLVILMHLYSTIFWYFIFLYFGALWFYW